MVDFDRLLAQSIDEMVYFFRVNGCIFFVNLILRKVTYTEERPDVSLHIYPCDEKWQLRVFKQSVRPSYNCVLICLSQQKSLENFPVSLSSLTGWFSMAAACPGLRCYLTMLT